jgi:predicted O-methyltransferase YrrM
MKYEIDNKNLGDWAISRMLLNTVSQHLPPNGTILELGSGTGTQELRKFARVISIEHDRKWAQPATDKDKTYVVPLDPATGWYDRQLLEVALREETYDLIIVDGPKRKARHGFLHNLDLFNHEAVIVIDDTNRQEIALMAEMVARTLNRKYDYYQQQGEKRTFVIFPKRKKVV